MSHDPRFPEHEGDMAEGKIIPDADAWEEGAEARKEAGLGYEFDPRFEKGLIKILIENIWVVGLFNIARKVFKI